MLRSPRPHLIFASALSLLLLSGAAAGVTIYRFYEGERWVRHTFEVELTLASIESDLAQAGRSRQVFVNGGGPEFLRDFARARSVAQADMAHLRTLTADNPDQADRCGRLQAAIDGRLGILEKSLEMAQAGDSDRVTQDALTENVVKSASEADGVSEEMKKAEEILLQRRTQITNRLFRLIVTVLSFTFLLSVFLIWEHYRRLSAELRQRAIAEQQAERLSLQVMRAQDEERHRISRELHDSLGQNLGAAKMIAESFAVSPPNGQTISDLAALLDEGLKSTRSMSYLLHPPLLDEMGLVSAAEWLIDGFSARAGVSVGLEVKGAARRLRPSIELTLFRILQESLTNIQRHARCQGAEVQLDFDDHRVKLRIRDHGVGISAEKLKQLENPGAPTGLGLTGMKQRAQEQGGTFRLSSDPRGTTIDVQLPTGT
jgi:signal transduction histidine kinase